MVSPNRFSPPSPYDYLPEVPPFEVTSSDISDGAPIDNRFVADSRFGPSGDNVSPALRWSGAPEGTASYAVTCFDPDAPTGSGFWHWVLFDIPSSVNELASGAGSGEMAGLPSGAIASRNDTGNTFYVGPFPPPNHGKHRYIYAVHALDVDSLGLDETVNPAVVGFNIWSHVIARAAITGTYEAAE